MEHGRGLPCGLLPEYNDISSDANILTGEFDESSKFNGAIFSRRCIFRADGERPLEFMFSPSVMRLQFSSREKKNCILFSEMDKLMLLSFYI